MTKAYQDRLIQLAKEADELNRPLIKKDIEHDLEDKDLRLEEFVKLRDQQFNTKFNQLVGYILALEGETNTNIENGHVNIKVAPEVREKVNELLENMKGESDYIESNKEGDENGQ